jgi:MtN3 and saliva related transmembrane protein
MHLPIVSHVAGFIANITSNFAFLPQIIKSYRRKRVEDISISMFFILFFTQLCWIIYAVPIGAQNLWISSSIEIALLLPLFVMWFLYREKKHHTTLLHEKDGSTLCSLIPACGNKNQ